jgi:hypothetical protein
MKLCLFPQRDDFVSFMRNLARHSAADICQRNFVRIKPENGHALLTDRAMNALALTEIWGTHPKSLRVFRDFRLCGAAMKDAMP